jgi:hypothetical protein
MIYEINQGYSQAVARHTSDTIVSQQVQWDERIQSLVVEDRNADLNRIKLTRSGDTDLEQRGGNYMDFCVKSDQRVRPVPCHAQLRVQLEEKFKTRTNQQALPGIAGEVETLISAVVLHRTNKKMVVNSFEFIYLCLELAQSRKGLMLSNTIDGCGKTTSAKFRFEDNSELRVDQYGIR